jgi:teichoic acid transport system ATP-binding protein
LGRNGSGKSTLLKLISSVTHPDSGSISVDGRISALLELKSGFNKEMTGIENIRFKALTMGIPKAEIEELMEEIIDFADLGEHINEPFRTYSSGMKARLGFAVAVNVNPDILIVDEALSVGDSVFRMKCITKMNEFREQGKTILFVSHSMNMVKAFCTRAIWINKGKLMAEGDMEDVVVKYSEFLKTQRALLKKKRKEEYKDLDQPLTKRDVVRPHSFKLINSDNKVIESVNFDDDWGFRFKYEVKRKISMLNLAFTVFNSEDVEVYSSDKAAIELDTSLGNHKVRVLFDGGELMPGTYYVTVDVWDSLAGMNVTVARLAALDIKPIGYKGTGIAYLPYRTTQRKADK